MGGVMTAYTRGGTTWSGMHQGLMTGILRGEWGNKAMCITDNILVTYCNGADAILAGGVTCFDAMLPYAVNALKEVKDDPVVVNAMVEAMHHNLYTIINSAAMNGVGPNTSVKAVVPGIINLITYVTIAIAILMVFFFLIKRAIKKSREEKETYYYYEEVDADAEEIEEASDEDYEN